MSEIERFSWEPHTFLNDYSNGAELFRTWSGRKTNTRIIVDEVAREVIDRLEADLAQARELCDRYKAALVEIAHKQSGGWVEDVARAALEGREGSDG